MLLGNIGTTVEYLNVPHFDNQNNKLAFSEIVSEIASGAFETVVIIGSNPVYTAPADLNFGEALSNASEVIHLSTYNDETGKSSSWHLGRSTI